MSTSSPKITPEPSGKERRAWVRYHSRPETPLFAIGDQEEIHTWKARVRDVSQGGMSLNVTSPFEIGSVVDIELSVPGADVSRTLVARVVRVEAQTGLFWLVACVFDQPLSDNELDKLADEQARLD